MEGKFDASTGKRCGASEAGMVRAYACFTSMMARLPLSSLLEIILLDPHDI